MMTEEAAVLVEQDDRVLTITLNRPDRRNALSREMIDQLLTAVDGAAQDVSVHVIVIRGAGPSFCAGYDIGGSTAQGNTSAPPSPQTDLQGLLRSNLGWERVWRCPIPIIAQVHGHCIAGGTDLALVCDLIVCANDARIGFPPVRSMGVPPTHMWLYHLGPQWTKRLLLTGDTVTGARAAQLGLVLEAVDADELDAHVTRLATRMAAVTRDLLIGNKYVVNRGIDLMGRAALQDISATQDTLGHLAPGVTAFWEAAQTKGLKEAFRERDAPFADGDPIS